MKDPVMWMPKKTSDDRFLIKQVSQKQAKAVKASLKARLEFPRVTRSIADVVRERNATKT